MFPDAKPEDIAKSILFLADTSQALHINGTIMEIFSNGEFLKTEGDT